MSTRILVAVLAVAALLLGMAYHNLAKPPRFRVDVLDVGQGDSILVTTPENIRILIDGGPGDAVLAALGRQLPLFSRRIDIVVLTHPDADHLEGLIPVLRKYKVSAVIVTETNKEGSAQEEFVRLASKTPIFHKVFAGDKITVSAPGGAETTFDVVWPLLKDDSLSANEMSVVARLSHQEYDFLLTGDIGMTTENKIASMIKPEFLQAEVLKVAHHGSRYSSADRFLSLVSPGVSVISAGRDNRHGHPTKDVLDRLTRAGSKVLRTDQGGTISFLLGPEGLVVKKTRR